MSPRGPRRRGWAGLVVALAAIALAVPLFFAADALLIRTQEATCGAATFLSAPSPVGHLLLSLPWFFPGVGVGFLVATRIHAGLRRLARLPPAASYPDELRGLRPFLGWTALGALLLSAAAWPSYFCASDSGLSFRRTPWSEPREYAWTAVRAVQTECYHHGRTNRDAYRVTMDDGTTIDLAERTAEFVRAFPRLRAALRGQPFAFTSVNGARSCPPRLKPLFEAPPG